MWSRLRFAAGRRISTVSGIYALEKVIYILFRQPHIRPRKAHEGADQLDFNSCFICRAKRNRGRKEMMLLDLAMLALVCGSFITAVGYLEFCNWILARPGSENSA